ncbi:MAG TPA: alkaline phosphatase PafA [Chitinophagaceae bacterium]|nr:alkaline phosphatase PafA [Chitinophagaceae bacterium]
MRFISALVTFLIIIVNTKAQSPADNKVNRPKLVVGIVVDQMRWDYLYRYYNRYGNNGFRRLLNQGFSCENTFIPYIPSVTACGHTCIYTGSVPAIHGIIGNGWYSKQKNKSVYCTDDESATSVGTENTTQKMSPRNMWVTTIGDELKLATNFRSKVISVAIKDRASILPAGHSADAAYWFDVKTGNWITSSFYGLTDLPPWVKEFNKRKVADSLMKLNWKLSYDSSTYVNSTADDEWYEAKFNHEAKPVFDHELASQIGKNYDLLRSSPMGNSMTVSMAKAALINEKLGQGAFTDLLAVSLSSPDGVGHSFGPNSREQEDDFIKLDKDLADLLSFLDAKIGKDQYLVFLSADHGVANIPGLLKEHHIPNGIINGGALQKELNTKLAEKFKKDSLVATIYNYQVYLNNERIAAFNLNENEIKEWIISYLGNKEFVARVFDITKASTVTLPGKLKEMVINGYYPGRSGDLQIILQPQWIDFGNTGTTHGAWNPYDTHIPLLFYGWNIKPGKLNREVYMTDIAATVCAMLKIQMPNGCIGEVIQEVMK